MFLELVIQRLCPLLSAFQASVSSQKGLGIERRPLPQIPKSQVVAVESSGIWALSYPTYSKRELAYRHGLQDTGNTEQQAAARLF